MSASTAELAVRLIKSGDRVFVHGGSAVPSVLLQALVNRSADLHDVELVHLPQRLGCGSDHPRPHLSHRVLSQMGTSTPAGLGRSASLVHVATRSAAVSGR